MALEGSLGWYAQRAWPGARQMEPDGGRQGGGGRTEGQAGLSAARRSWRLCSGFFPLHNL